MSPAGSVATTSNGPGPQAQPPAEQRSTPGAPTTSHPLSWKGDFKPRLKSSKIDLSSAVQIRCHTSRSKPKSFLPKTLRKRAPRGGLPGAYCTVKVRFIVRTSPALAAVTMSV